MQRKLVIEVVVQDEVLTQEVVSIIDKVLFSGLDFPVEHMVSVRLCDSVTGEDF